MAGTSVYIGYAHKGQVDGLTEDGLIEARLRLNADIPEATEMDQALGRIIDGPIGTDITNELSKDGIFLMGAGLDRRQTSPDALMYAEGLLRDDISFSVVRMGLWIVQAGAERPSNGQVMHQEQRESIRRSFLRGGGLADVDSEDYQNIAWGVPINKHTKIIPLHPQHDDIQTEFTYADLVE